MRRDSPMFSIADISDISKDNIQLRQLLGQMIDNRKQREGPTRLTTNWMIFYSISPPWLYDIV